VYALVWPRAASGTAYPLTPHEGGAGVSIMRMIYGENGNLMSGEVNSLAERTRSTDFDMNANHDRNDEESDTVCG